MSSIIIKLSRQLVMSIQCFRTIQISHTHRHRNAHTRSGGVNVIFIHSINAGQKSVHRKSPCRNYRFFHTKCDLQYDKSCLLQERWSDTPLPITRRCFYAVCRRRWTPRMSGKRISQVSPQSDTIIMLFTSPCEYKSGVKGIRVPL